MPISDYNSAGEYYLREELFATFGHEVRRVGQDAGFVETIAPVLADVLVRLQNAGRACDIKQLWGYVSDNTLMQQALVAHGYTHH